MLLQPLAEANGASVFHAPWESLIDVVESCDLLCVDTPYSKRVHDGHDRQVAHLVEAGHTDMRRELSYSFWAPEDVRRFVEAWHPKTRGWMVSITDHILARAWEEEMERVGRYVFPPIPYVAPGSRVRIAGDGPSSWTTWIVSGASDEIAGPCEALAEIVVSRPSTKEYAAWGTLPGAYILPKGKGVPLAVVGGKQPWLMQRLVEDYSRPGELVVDCTCGAGTTAIGAIRSGRRAIVGDADLGRATMAATWIKDPMLRSPVGEERVAGQSSMFDVL